MCDNTGIEITYMSHTPKKCSFRFLFHHVHSEQFEFMVTKHKLGSLIGSDRSAPFIFSQSKQISTFLLTVYSQGLLKLLVCSLGQLQF